MFITPPSFLCHSSPSSGSLFPLLLVLFISAFISYISVLQRLLKPSPHSKLCVKMVRDFPYPDWTLTNTSLGSKNGRYLTHQTRLTNASKVLVTFCSSGPLTVSSIYWISMMCCAEQRIGHSGKTDGGLSAMPGIASCSW